MPRHAPTRRDRLRLRGRPPQSPTVSELDPAWKPARRDSRLPAWIPAPLRKIIRYSFRAGIVFFCLLVAVSLFYLFLSFRYDIEDITKMPERSVILDMQGNELGTLHGESRRMIGRDEIPDFFVKALTAREDKRFSQHAGIDLKGLIRATLRNVKDRSFTQGASTLTMQLARNSFELREKSLHRKLIEMALAVRIEWEYQKDEILTAYINRIYFGSGCHGLDEAARRYFGISAPELTPGQCALLAGIIRGPHAFSPLRNLEAALAQRDEVLQRMVAEKFITDSEARKITDAPLRLRDPEEQRQGSSAQQAVRRHVEELLDAQDIRQGGLRLRSTIHHEIQHLLETELEFLTKDLDQDLQVAAVCINSKTGGVRAIVGGRSSGASRFNRALDARRDLGSIFSPFVYASCAERGKQPLLDQPVATGQEIGHENMVDLARRFGFKGPFGPGDDLYRGTISATPLEVVTASATLTSRGNRPQTYFLQELRDSSHNRIFAGQPSSTPAFNSKSAAAALAMQFPEGEPRLMTSLSPAKTDAWGVSCGSQHAICLWIGYDQPKRLSDPDRLLLQIRTTIERLALSLLP